MAHKKAGGRSRNGRDSEGRRLGVKKFGGEAVVPGNIILRQRDTKPGRDLHFPREFLKRKCTRSIVDQHHRSQVIHRQLQRLLQFRRGVYLLQRGQGKIVIGLKFLGNKRHGV